MEPLSPFEVIARVGAAVICGALVGLERERKRRPAGFRTMILISLGSCGFVLVGIEAIMMYAEQARAFGQLPPGVAAIGQSEISRVLQGLIGGIGFLGAGAVIQSKRAVRGVTTAAAVWVVAALGAACGLGFYTLAAIVGGATLFTLIVLELFEDKFFPEPNDGAFESKKEREQRKAMTEGLFEKKEEGAKDEKATSPASKALRGD